MEGRASKAATSLKHFPSKEWRTPDHAVRLVVAADHEVTGRTPTDYRGTASRKNRIQKDFGRDIATDEGGEY